jgi:mannitol-1-/sugar-/sorbitol-6-phosphatase
MTVISPRGLLFDSDGVLVDSDASVRTAWTRWADQYGLGAGRVNDAVHGRRSADTVAALLPAEQVRDALADIDRYEVEDAARVTALPGAADLLASLPGGSWAVVTSAVTALATARLAAAGLPLPEVLVTADAVERGKPEPEGYLTAAARLGIAPADCVVFEDAPSGIQAARAAAVGTVVGVGPRSRGLDVDLTIDDLSQARYHEGRIHLG